MYKNAFFQSNEVVVIRKSFGPTIFINLKNTGNGAPEECWLFLACIINDKLTSNPERRKITGEP